MKFLGFIAGLALSAVTRGFVLRQLWAWFIVHQFHADPISIPMALGISSTVAYLTAAPGDSKKEANWGFMIMHSLVLSGFALLSGWIWSLFL